MLLRVAWIESGFSEPKISSPSFRILTSREERTPPSVGSCDRMRFTRDEGLHQTPGRSAPDFPNPRQSGGKNPQSGAYAKEMKKEMLERMLHNLLVPRALPEPANSGSTGGPDQGNEQMSSLISLTSPHVSRVDVRTIEGVARVLDRQFRAENAGLDSAETVSLVLTYIRNVSSSPS